LSVLCNPRHRRPLHSHDTVFGQPRHVQCDPDVRRGSAADNTAAVVQQAAQGGWSLMIPGAFERRVGGPVTAALPAHEHATVMGERERLDYEREGGGAESERRPPGGYRAALARRAAGE